MADERIESFIKPEAITELNNTLGALRELTKEVVNANNAAKSAEGMSKQARTMEDVVKAGQVLVDVNGQIVASSAKIDKKWQESITLINQLNGHSKEAVQVKQELVRLSILESKAAEEAAKATARQAKSTAVLTNEYDLLKKAEREASAEALRLGAAFGRGNKEFIDAAARAKKLSDELKALEASVGRNQRSVGDYTIATRGLHGSIQQIARELPSLSGGFAIFTSAIGNNIAPAADAIRAFRAEQAALKAEGKATQSVFSALGGAILNWQTGLLIGVTLLTVYGKEIGEFAKELFKGKQALDAIKVSQEAYNKALEDPAIKDASAEFEQMEENIRLAKEGLLDKKKVLNLYNDSIGKTLGHAKDLNEAEDTMVRNKEAYLDMLRAKTVATSLYGQAATKAAEAAVIEARVRSGDIDFIDKLKGSLQGFSRLGLTGLTGGASGIKAAQERAEDLKQSSDIIFKAADEWEKKMAEIATKIGADPFGGEGDQKGKKTKTPKVKDLTDQLSKLKGLIIEFSIKLKLPEKSELDAISKELQNQIDIASNAIVFDLFDENAEAKAKADADRLLGVLKDHQQKKKDAKDKEAEDDKKRQEDLQAFIKTVNDVNAVFQQAAALGSALQSRRIQEIDAEIKKIEEKKQADIDAINAKGLSEEETRKRIAQVNIQAAAEEKRLEAEKLQRKRRAAAFDKAAAIGQIIAQTAIAVAEALPNFILSAAAAAAGGLALAKVIATPLPAYEKGTGDTPHKGGPARLFERNKPELVIEPSGRAWVGSRDGIYDLPKGTEVISNPDLMKLTAMYSVGMPALVPVGGVEGMNTAGLERKLDAVKNAIQNQPVAGMSVTGSGISKFVLTGNYSLRYIDNLRH